MSELPDGWAATSLKELVFLKTGPFGSSLHQSDYVAGGIPLVNPMHIVNGRIRPSEEMSVSEGVAQRLLEFHLKTGDVVLGRRGEMGRCAVVSTREEGWLCGTGSLIVRPNPVVLDPDFLQRFISSDSVVRYLLSASVGSTMANLNQEHLLALQINLPPTSEQTRIVAKLEELLSDLDAGVAELKAAQKKLAQYRQSLLKAAVEGALTAPWRAAQAKQKTKTETGAQLLTRILSERRKRWEGKQLARFAEQGKTPPKDWQSKYPEPVPPDTTDLPELPEGWVWATAEMLFSWGSGDFLPASAQIDGDYPVYGGNGINGRHNTSNVDHPTIVIGRVGVHCGNVYRTESSAWITDNAIYAIAKHEFITWQYSELVMQAANLGSSSKGGAQPFISQKILNDTFVALPPVREQVQIFEEYLVALNAQEEMATSIGASLKQSAAQRKNILKAAFSGQLVPQDPADEPASVLLARIRTAREAALQKPKTRRRVANA